MNLSTSDNQSYRYFKPNSIMEANRYLLDIQIFHPLHHLLTYLPSLIQRFSFVVFNGSGFDEFWCLRHHCRGRDRGSFRN